MTNAATPAWNLGFLTVVQEPTGFLGGYLVTNPWGRPLEFRLSTAVQPNRVQQILYGDTLQPYICADLIGKTLIDKTAAQAQIIVTDREPVLELRKQLSIPVALLRSAPEPLEFESGRETPAGNLEFHPAFPQDGPVLCELRERLGEGFDLAEPFARIRDAIAEARRMGVTSRG